MPELWTPLESNPEVITEYAASLGLDNNVLSFCDIMSTEEWALDMVPRPVHAVIMVYPIKDSSEARSKAQRVKIEQDGQVVANDTYYMKQTVPNACGTVAILHAIGNLPPDLFNTVVAKDSFLWKFFSDTKGAPADSGDTSVQKMTPQAIAQYLEEDTAIDALHGAASAQGQSEAPPDNLTNNHFVCFSLKGGCVYELDGRKEFPINHGTIESILGVSSTTDNSKLLEAAIAVIQKEFMAPDPEELRFTFIAMAGAGSD